jgi:hypothetical protein
MMAMILTAEPPDFLVFVDVTFKLVTPLLWNFGAKEIQPSLGSQCAYYSTHFVGLLEAIT